MHDRYNYQYVRVYMCVGVSLCLCVCMQSDRRGWVATETGSWFWQRTCVDTLLGPAGDGGNGGLATPHTRTRTSALVVGVPLARSRQPYAEAYTTSN